MKLQLLFFFVYHDQIIDIFHTKQKNVMINKGSWYGQRKATANFSVRVAITHQRQSVQICFIKHYFNISGMDKSFFDVSYINENII